MRKERIDKHRRRFLIAASSTVGGLGILTAIFPFLAAWWPSARARAAGAPKEVGISHLRPGERMTVEWRGSPVWIVRRTEEMLVRLDDVDIKVRDPESLVNQQPIYAQNHYRSIIPEYLVLTGICTHLGCAPKYLPNLGELGPDWPGGFYCPCHGSTFDLAGRVFKGVPAPINLAVPPHRFVNNTTIIIGEDEINHGHKD